MPFADGVDIRRDDVDLLECVNMEKFFFSSKYCFVFIFLKYLLNGFVFLKAK
jgi:hypothetical protein